MATYSFSILNICSYMTCLENQQTEKFIYNLQIAKQQVRISIHAKKCGTWAKKITCTQHSFGNVNYGIQTETLGCRLHIFQEQNSVFKKPIKHDSTTQSNECCVQVIFLAHVPHFFACILIRTCWLAISKLYIHFSICWFSKRVM